MYSLNKAQLIGNITRDPELRQIATGVSVASFTVATNQVWTDAAGVRQEKAEFHDIVAWRKLADICAQLLRKGAKVYVEGRIQTREWTGEDGVKRRKTEIVAENVIALEKKGDRADSGFTAAPSAPVAAPVASPSPSTDTEDPLQDKAEVADGASAGGQTTEPSEDITIDDLPF
ncbi:single-stranded DNA-binding protein [Candidatus Peregrinibacteria bacterium]|jgi:single-strand DNA-binding protein|nr:single-stranded DNA-binding protein [Candidatus Peregrinibacteria bacterium]